MQSLLADKKFIFAFTGWWVSWALLHTMVLTSYNIATAPAITDSVISNIMMVAGCLLININLKYYLPRKELYAYILVICLVISTIWLFIVKGLLAVMFKGDAVFHTVLSQSWPVRFTVALLMFGCMAMITMLLYRQKEQQEMEARKAEAEKLSKEAELFKLRQQLQPHFLFNSLNSISALTGTQPEKARHMIQQLSDFLRGTLRKEHQQWSTLEEELDYLQLYLDIEKVRFGHRLQTKIEYSREALSMKLPSLLLQPVVENAIKFGLYDTTGEVLIGIYAELKNEALHIKVENPFDTETAMPLKGTGFGLASIKRRLYLLFARPDLLQTEQKDNLFITHILIPQLK